MNISALHKSDSWPVDSLYTLCLHMGTSYVWFSRRWSYSVVDMAEVKV